MTVDEMVLLFKSDEDRCVVSIRNATELDKFFDICEEYGIQWCSKKDLRYYYDEMVEEIEGKGCILLMYRRAEDWGRNGLYHTLYRRGRRVIEFSDVLAAEEIVISSTIEELLV